MEEEEEQEDWFPRIVRDNNHENVKKIFTGYLDYLFLYQGRQPVILKFYHGHLIEQYETSDHMRRSGEYKGWHKNGKRYIHCFYSSNELIGEYKEWDESGSLKKHYFYEWATWPDRSKPYSIKDAIEAGIRGPWLKNAHMQNFFKNME